MRARSLLFALLLAPGIAGAQVDPCGGDGEVAGCAEAAIAYRWREGLPREFDFDTDWVPRGSAVQVRVRAVLAGNTQVNAAGRLIATWPEPMRLSAVGTPGAGNLSVDYGVVFSARLRLALPVGGTTVSWEGAIPYTPMIDFRAMSATAFDPWGWRPVMTAGRTARVRVADVRLTDAIVRIPGISGGFAFDAAGEVQATWRATRIEFGGDADPITEMSLRTQAAFRVGPSVDYAPRLVGDLGYTGVVHVYPSVYVSLGGRRWMLDLADLPIAVGPFARELRFDPSPAHLALPDISTDAELIDFGEVTVGSSTERAIELRNVGEGNGRVLGSQIDAPFAAPPLMGALPARGRASTLVSFAPTRAGRAESDALLYTSDPDRPTLRVRLRGVGVARDVPMVQVDAAVADVTFVEAGVTTATDDGGCGCRAGASDARGGFWALAAGAVLARRRRPRLLARRPS